PPWHAPRSTRQAAGPWQEVCVKLIGGRVALTMPGARVSRGPGVIVGGRWPGRVVKSGPTVGTGLGVGAPEAAAGLSATSGRMGAVAIFSLTRSKTKDPI